MNCPKCQTANPPAARFCGSCGATLAATAVQERTVVVSGPASVPVPIAPVMPQERIDSIVAQTQEALGPDPISIPSQPNFETINQREHTAFVTDVSGSMGEIYQGSMSKLEAAIRATSTMVLNKEQIDPYDLVGLVTFENYAQPVLNLSPIHSHKLQILQAVQSLSPGGGTDINEGLKVACDMFDWSRQGVVRRIVLLTDGHGGHPLRTAKDLKSRGVVIDVIGVGDRSVNIDEKLLKKVASVIEGEVRYRFIKDQQTLVAHYHGLANKTATGA